MGGPSREFYRVQASLKASAPLSPGEKVAARQRGG